MGHIFQPGGAWGGLGFSFSRKPRGLPPCWGGGGGGAPGGGRGCAWPGGGGGGGGCCGGGGGGGGGGSGVGLAGCGCGGVGGGGCSSTCGGFCWAWPASGLRRMYFPTAWTRVMGISARWPFSSSTTRMASPERLRPMSATLPTSSPCASITILPTTWSLDRKDISPPR